ncbi:MAG: zf-TFIIB domain-containing protein [Gammaproteobacteria bacterium]
MRTNCENCGSTLVLKRYQDMLMCDYCSTVHIPSLREDAMIKLVDGVTSDFTCPVCTENLSLGKVDEWDLLSCSGCRGLLIKQENFLNIIRYARSGEASLARKPGSAVSLNIERAVNCPDCSTPMATHEYYGPGDFIIDSCSDCRIVWLDGGELDTAVSARWAGTLWK